MNRAPQDLLALPSPFLRESSVLRLLEPSSSDYGELIGRIVGGSYDKPFIVEDDELRYLMFDLEHVQAVMRIREPYALDLAYTQKMMAFLLFNPQPRNIVLAGLGGGSLAKYCYRYLPLARITVIESNPAVIALREEFMVPRDDHRFQVLEGDGAVLPARFRRDIDVFLVDAFDRNGLSASLGNVRFYEDARRRLHPAGVLVMNLTADARSCPTHVGWIHEVFGDSVIAVPVADGHNWVVFAFKDLRFRPRWKWLDSLARRLKERLGLEFPRYVTKLARCHELDVAGRIEEWYQPGDGCDPASGTVSFDR
jgi:spermidine synthase